MNLDETASGSTLSAQINADHIAGVLRYSDNDGYDALWNAHLNSAIIPWSEGLVENPERMRGFQYPDVSAVELAKMWVKTYGYLFADAEGEPNAGETASAPAREWLASSMHHSLNSSIDARTRRRRESGRHGGAEQGRLDQRRRRLLRAQRRRHRAAKRRERQRTGLCDRHHEQRVRPERSARRSRRHAPQYSVLIREFTRPPLAFAVH